MRNSSAAKTQDTGRDAGKHGQNRHSPYGIFSGSIIDDAAADALFAGQCARVATLAAESVKTLSRAGKVTPRFARAVTAGQRSFFRTFCEMVLRLALVSRARAEIVVAFLSSLIYLAVVSRVSPKMLRDTFEHATGQARRVGEELEAAHQADDLNAIWELSLAQAGWLHRVAACVQAAELRRIRLIPENSR